jgi:hypothetical protein
MAGRRERGRVTEEEVSKAGKRGKENILATTWLVKEGSFFLSVHAFMTNYLDCVLCSVKIVLICFRIKIFSEIQCFQLFVHHEPHTSKTE